MKVVGRTIVFCSFLLSIAVGCGSTEDVGRATIDTDDPLLKPNIYGSASISATTMGWTLTLTNLRSGASSCDPANIAEAANVRGLFQLSVRIPTTELNAGSYANATAAFSTTDDTCSSTIGEVSADVQVAVDARTSGEHASGVLRVRFPSGLFVASWDAAECSAPKPDLASCRTLPACPIGAGGSLLCIDAP